MIEDERCPYCGSDNFDTDDYNENFDVDEVSYYWRCECRECKKVFHITKWYKLTETLVQTNEELYGLE